MIPPVSSNWRKLAKLVPGQSFSATALRRYDNENRLGLRFQPKLEPELGPDGVECCQPAWLFGVDPSAKNHKNDVCSCCIAANPFAIRPIGSRISNEDAAQTPCRTDPWPSVLAFASNFNRKVLSSQEFSGFEVDVFLFDLAKVTPLRRQFPAKRNRKQREDKPSKGGRIAHVSHLAR